MISSNFHGSDQTVSYLLGCTSTPVAKLERFFGLSSVSDGLAIKSEVKGSISLITSSSSRLIRLLEQSL